MENGHNQLRFILLIICTKNIFIYYDFDICNKWFDKKIFVSGDLELKSTEKLVINKE